MQHLPRAILFDLDETILSAFGRPDESWRAVLAGFAPQLAPLTPERVAAAIAPLGRGFLADPARYREWRFRLPELRRHLVARAFAGFAESDGVTLPAELGDLIADAFQLHRDAQLRPFPGAIATLETLRGQGVRLALITNGAAEIQREKVSRFALAPHFNHIQIEGEHGFGKPEPRAYTHALEALGVTPRDAWMVGDNLEWEVAAPQRLGIFAVWCDAHGRGLPEGSAVRPDRIIRSLPELLEPA